MKKLFWPAAALFVVLGAVAAVVAFREKKPPAPVDFAVYGDCRHQPKVHRRIAKAIAASGSKFVVVTGDLLDEPESEEAWTEFRDIVKDVRARGPYYCSIGNHDIGDKKLFQKEMGENRLYYDKREGDIHLFILDSCGYFEDAAQLEWLKKTAAASTSKHKFAVFHHPPFMIYGKRMAEAERIRPNIHPLLVQLKFCGAFCGHIHAFYTTVRDGVRYVVTAGGGAPLRDIDPALGQPGDLSRKFFHFVGVNDAGSKLVARVFDDDGDEDEKLAFTLCDHSAANSRAPADPVGPK